jgi:hypothetical protein
MNNETQTAKEIDWNDGELANGHFLIEDTRQAMNNGLDLLCLHADIGRDGYEIVVTGPQMLGFRRFRAVVKLIAARVHERADLRWEVVVDCQPFRRGEDNSEYRARLVLRPFGRSHATDEETIDFLGGLGVFPE